jgi:hypothetical protein
MANLVAISILGGEFDPISTTINRATSLLNPFKDVVTYLFPKIRLAFTGAVEIRAKEDARIDYLISQERRGEIESQVGELAQIAGVPTPSIYASTKDSFYSEGSGRLGKLSSCFKPIIHLPLRHIMGVNEKTRDSWQPKNGETEFFILRQLGHIKWNDQAIKLVARVAIVAALFLLYFHPLGLAVALPISIALLVAATLIHCNTHSTQALRLDAFAVEHLAKRYDGNELQAAHVAIEALTKIQKQNIYRRERGGRLSRLAYTPEGNSRFTLGPTLSLRIAALHASGCKAYPLTSLV